MQAIKRETSPELLTASIVPKVSYELPVHTQQTSPTPPRSNARDEKLSMPLPKPCVTRQAHLAPTAYNGSSPRRYKLSAGGDGNALISSPTPPVFSRLPSRIGSAMATGRGNTTTTITATATTEHIIGTPTLPNITHLTQRLQHTSYPEGNALRTPTTMMDPDHVGFPEMLLNGMLYDQSSQSLA
jgi:hypothetical protein